ncbi:MAG: sugar kinase [Pseudomonadota bacterium]
MRVACVGEVMVELSLSGDGQARIGVAGDTFNTAVYLKREAPGVAVSYITRLGQDAFSDQIKAAIEAEGVGTDGISHDPQRAPGLYAISTDYAGERSFTYWRGQSAARHMFDDGFEALEGYDVVYLSAITLAILSPVQREGLQVWLTQFRARGGRVAFDSNYRPKLWESRETAQAVVAAFWGITDIALPSVDDEMDLFGDSTEQEVVDRLTRYGVAFGALKRGANGPRALGPEQIDQSYTAAPVVRDSTAAGDSFNGGFLAATLKGGDLATALAAGHACAAWVVQHPGAIVPTQGVA